MRILIVDDSPMERLIIRVAIEQLGHECIVAVDGEEGWQAFVEGGADVILSDWVMPVVDGPELCRRIRGYPDAPYAYFIFLTALDDRNHALEGMEAGADDYLAKPLDPHELRMRLIAAERVTNVQRQLATKHHELEAVNRELHETARTDALTRLGNRLRLAEDLAALQARAERYGHGYAIALCDIDYFKRYNDRYGHQAGDHVLASVAATLMEQCRSGDSVYRYGGEEFLIVLPEQGSIAATVAIDRFRNAVENLQIEHAENDVAKVVTMSGGVAALTGGRAQSWEAVVQDADKALYAAKLAGRNRVFTAGLGWMPSLHRGELASTPA